MTDYSQDLENCKQALKMAENALREGRHGVATRAFADVVAYGMELEVWCRFKANAAKPVAS